jgi:hypothetical protein
MPPLYARHRAGEFMIESAAVADGKATHGQSLQRLLRLASGLLLAFVAFGFGAWFSGAVSWVGFYLGARGQALASLAQVTAGVGFAVGVAGTPWYAVAERMCRRISCDASRPTSCKF